MLKCEIITEENIYYLECEIQKFLNKFSNIKIVSQSITSTQHGYKDFYVCSIIYEL